VVARAPGNSEPFPEGKIVGVFVEPHSRGGEKELPLDHDYYYEIVCPSSSPLLNQRPNATKCRQVSLITKDIEDDRATPYTFTLI
jgi:hypothetical protein